MAGINAVSREALRAAFVPIIANSDVHAFLAAVDNEAAKPTVTVHCTHAASTRAARRELKRCLQSQIAEFDVRVEAHGDRDLEQAKSLEELFASVGAGKIIYDPTCSFERAGRLVEFARQLRRSLERRLVGVYWSSQWRTAYVVLKFGHYFKEDKVRVGDLARTEHAIWDSLRKTCGESAIDFISDVRIGFEAPQCPVVPIDRASHITKPSVANRFLRKAAAPILGTVVSLGAVNAANAADDLAVPVEPQLQGLPAVSAVNGKLAIFTGSYANEALSNPGGADALQPDNEGHIWGAMGSLSVPLGHAFGLQVDVLGSNTDDGHEAYGVGAHLFWRDPAVGLLGAIGSTTYIEQEIAFPGGGFPFLANQEFDIHRLGGEGELYLGNFTLAATAGTQFGNIDRDGFFGDLRLSWYATEDLVVTGGVEQNPSFEDSLAGTFKIEYQPAYSSVPGMTLFFDSAYASDDQYRAIAGIKFYFGAPKSLMLRHREDDPQQNLLLAPALSGGSTAKTYFY